MDIECQEVTKDMKGKCSSYNVPVDETEDMINFKVKTFKLALPESVLIYF